MALRVLYASTNFEAQMVFPVEFLAYCLTQHYVTLTVELLTSMQVRELRVI